MYVYIDWIKILYIFWNVLQTKLNIYYLTKKKKKIKFKQYKKY